MQYKLEPGGYSNVKAAAAKIQKVNDGLSVSRTFAIVSVDDLLTYVRPMESGGKED